MTPRPAPRTVYCRRQADECAAAASKTSLPDLKEAYVNLEQAWLQLAPEWENDKNSSIRPERLGHRSDAFFSRGKPRAPKVPAKRSASMCVR